MANRYSISTIFRAVDRVTDPIRRMQQRVRIFTNSLSDNFNSLNDRTDRLWSTLGKGIAVFGALSAAAIGVANALDEITRHDVEMQQLAKSVGVSVDFLQAMEGASSAAGFNLDNVVDLVEELNNKMGEWKGLGEMKSANEALWTLGVSYKKIKDLSPEKQFIKIMDAALKMKDQQKAAFAVDALMGGEANKLLGVWHSQGKTISSLIQTYGEMNLRTEESRKGAAKFQGALSNVRLIASNLKYELAGLTGGILTQYIDRITLAYKANKKLIQKELVVYARNLADAFIYLFDHAGEIIEWAKRVGIALVAFAAFTAVLKTFVLIMTVVNLVMAASPLTWLIAGIVLLVGILAFAIWRWNDFKTIMLAVGEAIYNGIGAAINWFVETLRGAHPVVLMIIAAITALMGPIGWFIGAALLIIANWNPIKGFFADMWSGITGIFSGAASMIGGIVDSMMNKIKGLLEAAQNIGEKVKNFISGGKDQVQAAQVNGPAARQGAQGATNTNNAEVTIHDKTGRAEVTKGGKGVTLQRSGGM